MKLEDTASVWETECIKKYGITTWVNDRLATDIKHSENVKRNRIRLIVFDDTGNGAELADINFAGLPSNFDNELKGKKVFKGLEYLILNKESDKFKRERKKVEKIIVTMGGSDTYGVTLEVMKILKAKGIKAGVVVGPCFSNMRELKKMITDDHSIIYKPASLIKIFYGYDLAVTGGGVTPFEANASGLPCIIIASEDHEIKNGIFLDKLGSSFFAGSRESMKMNFDFKKLPIETMSKNGMEQITTRGLNNIYDRITDA